MDEAGALEEIASEMDAVSRFSNTRDGLWIADRGEVHRLGANLNERAWIRRSYTL